ncbi:MAG: sterol desaturase family protein [Methylophaga sp.]|nr:sterol desaturase family protein [Methylophaga sp.]
MLKNLTTSLIKELEAEKASTQIGTGWISGVVALVLAITGFVAVLCLRYPDLLTVPEIRVAIDVSLVRITLHIVLILAFLLATVSLILRQHKFLGFTALLLVLFAVALGGSNARISGELTSGVYFGLDWFILNLTLTGIVFLPLERLFRRKEQSVFRFEWREDLLYFLISSVMVQSFTYLSFAPSNLILATAQLSSIQAAIVSQPLWLQFFEIMFLTDLVQYWVHRLFHKVPWLWKFHAVHHSARTLDWMAGSRMHVVEIICLRGLTVIPMTVLGFDQSMLYLYLIVVYLYATYIHSNIKFDIEWIKPILVTPRYHHWHHGIEKEAIDVNFSIHFPIFDRLFGTYFMPKGRWPSGLGVNGHPVPSGYWKQFLYPFTK